MSVRNILVGSVLCAALLTSGGAFAQRPKSKISPARHPNLAAAVRLTDQAFQKITAAQQANEWDMDGHAAKAKDLLQQADNELKAAAKDANQDRK